MPLRDPLGGGVDGGCPLLPHDGQGDRLRHFARPERAPRPSRRPLRGLLRMRLSGIDARQNDGRTLGPHPEGPPTADVSKDGRRESARTCDCPAVMGTRPPMPNTTLLQGPWISSAPSRRRRPYRHRRHQYGAEAQQAGPADRFKRRHAVIPLGHNGKVD